MVAAALSQDKPGEVNPEKHVADDGFDRFFLYAMIPFGAKTSHFTTSFPPSSRDSGKFVRIPLYLYTLEEIGNQRKETRFAKHPILRLKNDLKSNPFCCKLPAFFVCSPPFWRRKKR
jgi:hypothetical protein